MKINYKIAILFLVCAGLLSCKKTIDLNLAGSESQLIIEGNIADIAGTQTVSISKSVNFDAQNTFPGVSGASVKVTDNGTGTIYTFTERTPGTYTINNLVGRLRRNYTLRVVLDGKTYTANSTMPSERVIIDSVTTSDPAFDDEQTKTVFVYYQDPPGTKNFYRMVMYVNGVQAKAIFVRNDEYSDGRQVQAKLYQSDIVIKSGDRVDVDLQGIDETIYNYWFTFSRQFNQFGDSATPTNPPNNFDTKVLGYFSVRSNFRRSFIVR